MTWQQIILGLIVWAQTCLIFGVLLNQITFEKFISIQLSIIMLLLPSPFKDKDNNS